MSSEEGNDKVIDTNGKLVKSDKVVYEERDSRPYYSKAADFWANVEATDSGMLCGLENLSLFDIQSSESLLKTVLNRADAPDRGYAIDCGAGIGRITKNLLSRYFDSIDLVDQDPRFISKATLNLEGSTKVKKFYCSGLQKFSPEVSKYDVIWIQWVLLYLTDEDCINFLNRCKEALRPRGVIFVKENTTRSNVLIEDEQDSSATRSFMMFTNLFSKAGLKVIERKKQNRFPKELYPVWSFALKLKTLND